MGNWEGDSDGLFVGMIVDGLPDGILVGVVEGDLDGCFVGITVDGLSDGNLVGLVVEGREGRGNDSSLDANGDSVDNPMETGSNIVPGCGRTICPLSSTRIHFG